MTEAEKERVAVVAWLRREVDRLWHAAQNDRNSPLLRQKANTYANVNTSIADAIESGEHLKEGR